VAGATEMTEFRTAGHTVRKGFNDIRLGIAAVTARIRTGRLKVNPHRCPNLVGEAKLYRYPSESERAVLGEKPIDEHNHALGALRYLISRLDSRFIAKLRKVAPCEERIEIEAEQIKQQQRVKEAATSIFGAQFDDENLWTRLN
jgi:hypothetical protein